MTVCVQPVVSRRVLDTDGLQAKDLEVQQLQVEESKSKSDWGSSALDVEEELLVRECVAATALDWQGLHKRLGIPFPSDKNVADPPVDLVVKIFKLKDKMAERQKSRSSFQNMVHWSYFSSRMQKWEEEEKQAKDDLLAYRFVYDIAFARCAKGATDLCKECMMNKACPNSTADCKHLQDSVAKRVDAKRVVYHLQDMRSFWGDYSKTEAAL